jgi:hypothetical protein
VDKKRSEDEEEDEGEECNDSIQNDELPRSRDKDGSSVYPCVGMKGERETTVSKNKKRKQ